MIGTVLMITWGKWLIGWDNFYWTFIHWYEAIFELDEEWSLSLWCFWDDLRGLSNTDRFGSRWSHNYHFETTIHDIEKSLIGLNKTDYE